jgi:hypothetical protein
MNLGELKADLKKRGIQVIGTLRVSDPESASNPEIVIFFSSDRNILFPFPPKNIFPLPMKSDNDNEHVNSEKIKALKRRLLPVSRKR